MKMRSAPDNNSPAQLPVANPSEFESLLRSSMDDLMVKTRSHQDAWAFGQEEQWYLDHGSGELVFTFPEVVVSAPAQIIGTWQEDTGIWTWGWADSSLPEHLQTDSLRVRQYGEEQGFQHLVTESWEAEESHCWYMTALASWLCEAKGAYCGITGNTRTYMAFGQVVQNSVFHDTDAVPVSHFMLSAANDFRVCAAFPDEQRKACCRYLRSGALEGIDQAELIHQLGLATPSVLDLAGYSPDAAQSVMDILKTISDEEIATNPLETQSPGEPA